MDPVWIIYWPATETRSFWIQNLIGNTELRTAESKTLTRPDGFGLVLSHKIKGTDNKDNKKALKFNQQ